MSETNVPDGENRPSKTNVPEGQEPLSGAELVNPYSRQGASKSEEVEEMFDSIAPAYDLMNGVMTLGLHRVWRDEALRLATLALRENGIGTPASVIDIATGTGDVAFSLARRFPETEITGIDISPGMLAIARRKLAEDDRKTAGRIRFQKADCLALPFADDSFQLATVAYGVRNFEHLLLGYREMLRVLAPGGVLCVIELSRPANRFTGALYDLYSRILIPAAGRIVSGDRRAYSYLPESIAAAPQRKDMAKVMARAGFSRCRWKSLSFGAVTIYIAQKPGADSASAANNDTLI